MSGPQASALRRVFLYGQRRKSKMPRKSSLRPAWTDRATHNALFGFGHSLIINAMWEADPDPLP